MTFSIIILSHVPRFFDSNWQFNLSWVDGNDIMTTEKALLQDELKRVEFRIQILNLIEDKLREIKALAEQAGESELSQEEISRIQLCVNQLISEINALDKIDVVGVIH